MYIILDGDIRTARANTPEMSMMMDLVQNKLGMMTDVEYSVYDFSVDEEEYSEEESDDGS